MTGYPYPGAPGAGVAHAPSPPPIVEFAGVEKTFNPGTPNISYGRVGDYQLSSCSGYWLQVTGDYVTGALVQSPRWEREPKMTPVLLDLVAAFVHGKTDAEALLHASREDPALRELKLDTRAFLRGDPE